MATKRTSARRREARQKRKIIIFAVEVVIILVMIIVLAAFLHGTDKRPNVTELDDDPEKLLIPVEVQKQEEEGGAMHGYMNVALFGVDAKTDKELFKSSRSDSIMVASINLETGDIKLVSVYRDTYLNLGNDTYDKCNSAYSYGGAQQALSMLNTNLDMNIKTFVTVGYKGLSEIIDGLGGVWIDVDNAELQHINSYQISIAEVLKCSYEPVTQSGYQKLNGIQATAYCRIRYTAGNDFKRAERQREVIKAIEDQAKQADLATLTKVYQSAIDDVYTNIDEKDIMELLGHVNDYRIVDENGFPQEDMRDGDARMKGRSVVLPTDLESNVVWLHRFLFDDEAYEVSSEVQSISRKINAEYQQ